MEKGEELEAPVFMSPKTRDGGNPVPLLMGEYGIPI